MPNVPSVGMTGVEPVPRMLYFTWPRPRSTTKLHSGATVSGIHYSGQSVEHILPYLPVSQPRERGVDRNRTCVLPLSGGVTRSSIELLPHEGKVQVSARQGDVMADPLMCQDSHIQYLPRSPTTPPLTNPDVALELAVSGGPLRGPFDRRCRLIRLIQELPEPPGGDGGNRTHYQR